MDHDGPSVLGLQSATDAAAGWIQRAILNGRFHPGERLIELTLAKKLGIGQPTLREALKELELQGFVRKVPKHGTYVTKLGHEDFREILETRVALEEVAIRRATAAADAEDVKELRQLQERMVEAAQDVDRTKFHAADMQFHRSIWALSGNAFLAECLEKVAFAPFVFFLLQRTPEETESLQAAAASHELMIDGIETGDPGQAVAMYREATLSFWKEQHDIGSEAP